MQAIRVQSYAGYKGNQQPTAFECEGRLLRIRDIVSQWVEQDQRPGGGSRWCYRVLADNGTSYLLVFDDSRQAWYLNPTLSDS